MTRVKKEKKYITRNGKRYWLYAVTNNKINAKRLAKNIRKKGYLARVIYLKKSAQGSLYERGKYAVYIRKRR